MILTDTGPLIAIIDTDDSDHQICVAELDAVALPLQTVLPVLTEAMHMLGRMKGWQGQSLLWDMILKGDLQVIEMTGDDLKRVRVLMEKYNSLPMDLADASLVAVAERLNRGKIFTLDSDFNIYRLHGRRPFDVIPE
ncbi:MAG: PIN domain-containing protein [Planctomycetes bacterium]|nr:PIN domain-containing protein [Planctomycetota bacterium]